MEDVWAKVLQMVASGEASWLGVVMVVVLICCVAAGRAVLRAKKFRLVIEYISGDK